MPPLLAVTRRLAVALIDNLPMHRGSVEVAEY